MENTMRSIEALSKSFSKQLTSSLSQAVTNGRQLKDIFSEVALSLSKTALTAALQPVQQGIADVMSGAISGLLGGIGGGAAESVQPFAKGGVVSRPTYFPMSGGGLGLMGEAGAEAILPLQRGSDGRLGVATSQGAHTPSVNITVVAQDLGSFERSQTQIANMVARAAGRGQRGL
nr:phage tail tape measure protein [Pseudovibrio flavus]